MTINISFEQADLLFRAINAQISLQDDWQEEFEELRQSISDQGGKALDAFYDRRAQDSLMDRYNGCMESGSHMA